MKPTTVKMGLLTLDDACQTRADTKLDADHVEALATAYAAGEAVAPLTCVEMADGSLTVVDGYHRWAALAALMKRAPKAPVLGAVPVVVVAKGDRELASFHALAANAAHGIRRTNADKRHAIKLALAHPLCRKMGVGLIAQHLGVNRELVSAVREEVLAASSPKAEATAKAAAAATEEVERRAKGGKPKPARQVAAEAGVSRKAVDKALGRVAVSGNAPTPIAETSPIPSPDASLHVAGLASLATLERETRALRAVLSTSDRQAWEGHAAKLRWLLESSRPERCPAAEHGDRCCAGTLVVRADDAKRISR